MYNPLCLYFPISIMSRRALSDDEIRLLLSKNDDLGEEELVPCNDSEVEDNVLNFGSLTSFFVVETNLINIERIILLFQAPIFQIFFLFMN